MVDILSNHYHQPSDQIDLPIHYAVAAIMADLNAAIGFQLANLPVQPRWNAGNFFGGKFAAGGDQ